MDNILKNITVLRNDMKSKQWIITAFDFTYNNISYIVIFECLDKSIEKNKYYISQLTFINTENNNKLVTLANSIRFSISIVEIRRFFQVNYVENLGNFEEQFYKYFSIFIPTTFHRPTGEQLEHVINVLNNRDNDNNRYCYAVRRNGKSKNENQMKRTIYNDNKTRLLRPSLYDHFKNDKTISFCYKPLPSDEKDDNTIILNFSKNQNN